MLLIVPPQYGVDARLIAFALRAKPFEHVGVESQRHVRLVARLRQLGREPVDFLHRVVGIAARGQGFPGRLLPVGLDRAPPLHRAQLTGRVPDDMS